MPWRLPAWADKTFPVPVTLKRFLAPDLVFILGIWLVSRAGSMRPRVTAPGVLLLSLARRHGSPLAGQRKGGVMAEATRNGNRARAGAIALRSAHPLMPAKAGIQFLALYLALGPPCAGTSAIAGSSTAA